MPNDLYPRTPWSANSAPFVSAATPASKKGKRLLFIGGSSNWFAEVEKHMVTLRHGWVLQHAPDLAKAAPLLNSEPVDFVILDSATPASSPVVRELKQSWPRLERLLLAECKGASEGPTSAPASGGAQQAHWDAETVIRHALFEEWTAQPTTKNLLAKIRTLPTLPRLYLEVTRELQSAEGSLEVVSQLVREDPVMSAKFLQVINSAGSGMSYTITDPGEAVMFIGAVKTRALVLMSGVFSQFDDLRCPGISAEDIWQHSLLVARLAQGVALVQTEDPKLAETAFTAGLLHDIGKLVLASNVPDMYATAHKLQQTKRIQESEAEMAILNTSHAEIGGSFLANWQLPLPIVEAVGWHHTPGVSLDQSFSILSAVHVGNVLAHETEVEPPDGIPVPRFDMMYLIRLGLASRRNFWRENCGLPIHEEECSLEEAARRRAESGRN